MKIKKKPNNKSDFSKMLYGHFAKVDKNLCPMQYFVINK